ncbi:MAG: hypothetical protein D6729_19185, partial [Deltaproteobacteria bacterium]
MARGAPRLAPPRRLLRLCALEVLAGAGVFFTEAGAAAFACVEAGAAPPSEGGLAAGAAPALSFCPAPAVPAAGEARSPCEEAPALASLRRRSLRLRWG